jgi:peptidoglycan/xylan/chitin deacetylase (PgdA/CDA1 family)
MLKRILSIMLAFIFALQLIYANGTENTKTKKIAVTMDDLPLNIAGHVSNEEMKQQAEKILGRIKTENIPIVAFVNEIKLEKSGVRDPERVNILRMWRDAGVELGNHTYAHKSGNQVPIEEYKEDIVKGEKTIKEIAAEKNTTPRYFRHPFLQTGRTLEYKHEVEKFIAERGYIIAPVTIDNSEWVYSAAYDKAIKANDQEMMAKIGKEYIDYMKSKLIYYERQSQKLFNRQINQILLIHSNRINADYFNKLCGMIREEGYEFITLEEALIDEAYKSADTFIGGGGISWLDRWAITRGVTKDFFAGEPRVPEHIMKYAGIDSE